MPDAPPLLSIIVPVFNVSEYLPACLDSILAQTFWNFELILVDDGSTDQGGAICDAYAVRDTRILLIRQANQGVAAARNTGLDAAGGVYIGFVDPDDRILPEMYATLVAAMEQSGADMVQCATWVDSLEAMAPARLEEKTDAPNLSTMSGREFLRLAWEGNASITLWCNLYRASLWKEMRFCPGFCYEDEMLFPLLVCRSKRVAVLADKLYVYRRNKAGIVRGPKTMMHLKSQEKVLELLERARHDLKIEEGLFAFYLCRMIPAYRQIIRHNALISPGMVQTYRQRRHQIFRAYFPLARRYPAYARSPLAKRMYWHLYALAPRLAEYMVCWLKNASDTCKKLAVRIRRRDV